MRLALIPALLAGATLVAASPIRVEVITFEQINAVPARFGHAVHQANNEHVATLIKPGGPMRTGRKPCGKGRSRFHQKAVELSNAFREALGLPPIETNHHPHHHPHHHKHPHQHDHKKIEEEEFHILPLMGTTSQFELAEEVAPGVHTMPNASITPSPKGGHSIPHPHHYHGHRRFRERLANAPFGQRLVLALDTLGTWEGRAVAFVLGCGLGVLLRMFWVLTVVAYRTVRGSGREERADNYVLFVEEISEGEQDLAVAPPTYTLAADMKENPEKETAAPATSN